MAGDSRAKPSRNPLEVMASLRTAVGSGSKEAMQAVVETLDAMEAAVSRVVTEHSGMANELLRVYEQLGIVFEVTRHLSTVGSQREVLWLFVQNLQTTYPDAQVAIVEEDDKGNLTKCKDGAEWPDWVRAALASCRDEHRVVVADCPDCSVEGSHPKCTGCPEWGRCDNTFLRVLCGPIYAGDSFVCALLLGHDVSADSEPTEHTFDSSDMLLLESLNLFCGDMIRNFRLVAELRQLSVDMVRVLISAIEQKDEYTSGHSTRVGMYAVLLGGEFGLDTSQLQMLEWSALLHDIGKIGIRDEVLKKPGRLTEEEFEHIKEHPLRSYNVVREVAQLSAALEGVVHHHEHWDGSGYPDGLAGEEIPLQARLIQVADIFDALTSSRSYRKPYNWSKALSILREEAGKTVDPKLAACFDRLLRRMAEHEPQRLHQIMSVQRRQRLDDLTQPEATPAGHSRNGDA